MARSKRPLYIPLFPADFMGDPNVRSMTNTQIGIYMILIMTAWQETPPCTLPDDPEALARWSLCKSVKEWHKLSPPVMACWLLVDGRWINNRLKREYDGRVEASEKAAAKGKHGAEKRWNTPPPDDGTGIAQALNGHSRPAIDQLMPGDGSRIPYPVSHVSSHTSSPSATPSLSGISLDQNQTQASNIIFAAASETMRPKGSAGESWVIPLHQANRLAAAIDSMLVSGPARIDGAERQAWEFADEICVVVRGSTPSGFNGLCNFIVSIWARCQARECRPGDPHKSTALKIERPATNANGIDPVALAAKVKLIGDAAEEMNRKRKIHQ